MTDGASELAYRLTVTGATLASLLEDLVASPGDCDGVLFGSISRRSVSQLEDDEGLPGSREDNSAHITGYCSAGRLLSFYDAAGAVDAAKLAQMTSHRSFPGEAPLGWFVSRRNTALRPSMREAAVTAHLRLLSKIGTNPCFLCLFSASVGSTLATHTYDYRAFQHHMRPGGGVLLEPRAIQIVNIGPGFRGDYESFTPTAPFPWLSLLRSTAAEPLETAATGTSAVEAGGSQSDLDRWAEGFATERLADLAGAGDQVKELEALYNSMMARLQGLAELVGESSAAVASQEDVNMQLRSAVTWKV